MATSDVLAGRRWVIESIGGTELLAYADVTMEFGHDGRVGGSTGINSYTASYAVLGDIVEFGPLATTRRTGDPAVVEQEPLVVGSIAGRCTFAFEGPRFVFQGPFGEVRCWPIDVEIVESPSEDPVIEAGPPQEPEPEREPEPRPSPRPNPRPES